MKPKKIAKKFKDFGTTRTDNYYWMRDKTDPDVLPYIKYENSVTDTWMSDTKRFQEKLFKELKSRKKDRDESVPYFQNGYWYQKKFEKGKEYAVIYRRKGSLKARAEKVLDQNELAKGKKYFQIGSAVISPDNRYCAYVEDVKADKRYVMRIKDLYIGKNISDVITDASTTFEWTNDSKSIVYVEVDAVTLRPYRVKRHVLGVSSKRDKIVFEEKNDTYYVEVAKTRSKKYLMIGVGSHDHDFSYYMDADGTTLIPKLFTKAKAGISYDVNHANGFWYVRTNERAIDFEIFRIPESNIQRKNWESFIPPQAGSRFEGFLLFKNYLVYKEVIAGIPYFHVTDISTKRNKTIRFPEKLYSGDFLHNPEFDSKDLRISLETMKDPITEYEYDMHTGVMKVLKVHKPKGAYSGEKYTTKRLWATGHDGVKIPLSVIHKKGIVLDGSNPCLLYGYGSYGFSLSAEFNENSMSLVDRGFVYVFAHIRGGQEMGRQWYLDGKFLKKKNTFLDFISCAELLIKKRYTRPEFMIARGGSAGGLLMGAVANMRPDLFRAMVFQVPFVDVINTMLDPSIPLTTGEYVEWGDPRKKKYFEYMKSYAPYENISKQEYPMIFIDSGFNDTQVHYWEPLKYIAKMKDVNPDMQEIFLRMDLDTGHGGKSGRFAYLYDVARIYAFICKAVGIMR